MACPGAIEKASPNKVAEMTEAAMEANTEATSRMPRKMKVRLNACMRWTGSGRGFMRPIYAGRMVSP